MTAVKKPTNFFVINRLIGRERIQYIGQRFFRRKTAGVEPLVIFEVMLEARKSPPAR
jgi:hypothetical protein